MFSRLVYAKMLPPPQENLSTVWESGQHRKKRTKLEPQLVQVSKIGPDMHAYPEALEVLYSTSQHAIPTTPQVDAGCRSLDPPRHLVTTARGNGSRSLFA